MRNSKKIFKGMGVVGIGLCAACCLLPIVSALVGFGALTVISDFLEIAGMIALAAAAVFLLLYFFHMRKRNACDIDCSCKGELKAESLEQRPQPER